MDKITIGFIVLYSYYCLEPFFIWKTFANGFFRSFAGMVPYKTIFGILIVGIFVVKYMRTRMPILKFGLVILALIVAVCTVCLAGGISISRALSFIWFPYLVVNAFIMLPKRIQRCSYEIFVLIFAITLILPIIYYVLTKVGIHIPYGRLESAEEIKVIRGKFYKLYPLCPQLTAISNPKNQEFRMSGIYDEAGRLGTIAALILASEHYNIRKNWKNKIIFIGGLFSFSLAFYLIGVIYFLGVSVSQKNYKKVIVFAGLIIAYLIFINIDFSNPQIERFQERFLISSDGLSGDNRTSQQFNQLMTSFYRSDAYSLLFGKGDGAIEAITSRMNIDGSSYKCLIYDYGIVGFGLSVVWLCFFAYYSAKKPHADVGQIVALLIVYFANLYQRPTIFFMGYLIIMFGGMIIASDDSGDIQNDNSLAGIIGRLFNGKSSNTISNI